ncbi:hypothetical protein SDC9_135942 [bioreactor metagenome]|uniref:Uncharacterized protein n=1 Tax=bioreactor metagenome TaxID=1076179 RepID=A0A645DIJ4_9ZZZZ
MRKQSNFIFARIILLHDSAEIVGIIDRARDDLHQPRPDHPLTQFRPQAAQHLRENSRPVIVRGLSPVRVRQNHKHRDPARIDGRGKILLEPVETRQSHFESGFASKGAGFQIDHPIDDMFFLGMQHRFQRFVIPRRDSIGGPDQFPLQQTGQHAAGVVVRQIGDPDPGGVFQQFETGEIMPQRSLVMLAFSDEGDPAVFTDPDAATAAERSAVPMKRGGKRMGRSSRERVFEPFRYFFSTAQREFLGANGKGVGPEFHFLSGETFQRFIGSQPQRGRCTADGIHVIFSGYVGQRSANIGGHYSSSCFLVPA